jgi:hypothetical protein
LVVRDLAADPVPHLDGARVASFFARPEQRSAEQRAIVAYSDALIGELRRADVVVLGLPMYNFGVPSQLKAWFDHIARAGETFRYTDKGSVGLLKGKKAYVIAARGGEYAGTRATGRAPSYAISSRSSASRRWSSSMPRGLQWARNAAITAYWRRARRSDGSRSSAGWSRDFRRKTAMTTRKLERVIPSIPLPTARASSCAAASARASSRATIRSSCWTSSIPTIRGLPRRLPSHPHRGFETVTYMLDGHMQHKDNHGNPATSGLATCNG